MKIPEGATHYNKALPFPYLRNGDIPAYRFCSSWIDYVDTEIGIKHINGAIKIDQNYEIKTMQPKIDFSKAPEGATHYARNNDHEDFTWYKKHDGWMLLDACGWMTSAGYNNRGDWSELKEIPKQPWNGEGLPPVGTVCDMLDDKNFFVEVEIIAIKSLHAFGWSEDRSMAYFSSNPDEFRPIQTPEQIEAKNREDFVKKASSLFFDASGGVADDPAFNALYNAGCRFQ